MQASGDRHLDLGCGKFPRNPYDRSALCGVDIRPLTIEGVDYRPANLTLEPIPFADEHFASVSAFDFIEHVPRMFPNADGRSTRAPFIELMNEVWRVLEPGGRFYAITPAWPYIQAFSDPTHVNIITEDTLAYFVGDNPLGRMYGFQGTFKKLRQDWVNPEQSRHADADNDANALKVKRYDTPAKRLAQRWRHWSRRMRGKPEESFVDQHWLRWELEAVKP